VRIPHDLCQIRRAALPTSLAHRFPNGYIAGDVGVPPVFEYQGVLPRRGVMGTGRR